MQTIDGSQGEGGGQILRTALSLAALSAQSLRLINIRANRKNPGLAPQHLTVVKALAKICQAEINGDELGSTEVHFEPTVPPQAGDYSFNVADWAENGSAGSVTLLAQALLPPLLATGETCRLQLEGGTHVRWSPSYEYFEAVYAPIWRALGNQLDCELIEWGFYPAGGGKIELNLLGGSQDPNKTLDLTSRGELLVIEGEAVAANLPSHIPQRMTDRTRSLLAGLAAPFRVKPRRVRSLGPAAGLFLTARYERATAGFSSYGELGKPAEQVAEEACEQLLSHHERGFPVDQHLADQILIPLALVRGKSSFTTQSLTAHFRTNTRVIQALLPAAKITHQPMAGGVAVRVQGAAVNRA